MRPGPTPTDNPHHFLIIRVDGAKLSLEVLRWAESHTRPMGDDHGSTSSTEAFAVGSRQSAVPQSAVPQSAVGRRQSAVRSSQPAKNRKSEI